MYTTFLYNFIYNDPHSQLFYKSQFFFQLVYKRCIPLFLNSLATLKLMLSNSTDKEVNVEL